MPALASLPHHRLLVSLLVALAATACAEERERKSARFTYFPGRRASGTQTLDAPDGPCVSASDPALPRYLGFFCVEDARIESGPVETTTPGSTRTCGYDVSWLEPEEACGTPGRPLFDRGTPLRAGLCTEAAWSARS